MSYAPASLKGLAAYWVTQGGTALGIVGDAGHTSGYHLGKDRIYDGTGPGLGDADYSVRTTRDRAGLTNAASAIDLGRLDGSLTELQHFSTWLVEQCRSGAIGTADIREIVYSPDGHRVLGYNREAGIDSLPIPDYGDPVSHLSHTHISFYRDSESRAKVPLFARYFTPEAQETMEITAIKGEDWKATPATGAPVRDAPDRHGAVIIARIPTGDIVRTIAEAVTPDGNRWRLTELAGRPGWLLRIDLEPVTPGGNPAVDAGLTEYIARRTVALETVTVVGRGLEVRRGTAV